MSTKWAHTSEIDVGRDPGGGCPHSTRQSPVNPRAHFRPFSRFSVPNHLYSILGMSGHSSCLAERPSWCLSIGYAERYTARMDESKKQYEVLDAVADQRVPMPRLSPKKDGFSRQDVVDALQGAFTMIGGVQRLALWANANPDKFYPLYARMLPSTAIQFGDTTNVQILHALAPTELDRHPGPGDASGGVDQVADGRRASVHDLPVAPPVSESDAPGGRDSEVGRMGEN